VSDFNLGDLLSLIIVFAVYLMAASSGRKKKNKRKQRDPMRSRAQGEQRDARAARRDAQTQEGFSDVFAQASKPLEQAKARCDTRQIHLHEVTQQQLEYAGEGEDPCHAGGFFAQEEERFDSSETQGDDKLAQDVLRGVIMSEILARPHERAALRRGRR